MIKNYLMGSAATAMSVIAMMGSANAVLIDNFTAAPQAIRIIGPEAEPVDMDPGDEDVVTLLDNAGGLAVTSAGPHASILGGYRDVATTLLVSPNEFSATTALASISSGVFSHGQDPGVTSHSAITWDGLTGGGLGNADFTDGGNSLQFHLVLLEADASVRWSIELFDGLDSAKLVFGNPTDVVLAGPPAHLYIPFAWFTANPVGTTLTGSFSLANFASVDRMIFTANVTDIATFDTQVALIETTGVPEPASLTLLGAGIMGLGYFGKRKRKA